MQIVKKTGGILLSRIQCFPLSSLSGSAPGNVRWCPSLALGSLFEAASDPQSVAVSFKFGWIPLFCPGFPSALGPGLVLLMTWEDYQYLVHLPPHGASGEIRWVGILGHPWGAIVSLQRGWWEYFPLLLPHVLVCPRFFPIMYGFCWICWPFPVRGQFV